MLCYGSFISGAANESLRVALRLLLLPWSESPFSVWPVRMLFMELCLILRLTRTPQIGFSTKEEGHDLQKSKPCELRRAQ